jgi:broad specificity phosphatase PhoE
MKLIIVRHGETVENAAGMMMGQHPGHLSELGITQAKKLGERLRNQPIDCIYSSDLKRTKDTVKEIIKYHTNVPVIYEPLLREGNNGIYDGKSKDIYHEALAKSGFSSHRFRPEGGESKLDLKRRVGKFIKYLLENHQDNETVLLCTHGGWKHAFMCNIWQLPPGSRAIESLRFKNTAVTVCELNQDGDHKVHLLNCIKHLD